MSDIRLVLTDFDGTVAEVGKHVVSDAVRDAVIRCEESGIRMVPVTGRYHRMALPVLELLGFEDLGIFDNGATIQNCKSGEIIWSQWMSPEKLKEVASICVPFAHIIDYEDDHIEHEPADNELEQIQNISRPAPHVYALVDPQDLDKVTGQLAQVTGITFYGAPSIREEWPDAIGIQVNHEEADKYHGVNALRDIVGIAKEHTLAIGDGDNDVALFNNAHLKIAMGNATDTLKAQADHLVGTVQEDGFAEAMRKFVL